MARIENQNANIDPQGFCIVGCAADENVCNNWTNCVGSSDPCKDGSDLEVCGACQKVINETTSLNDKKCQKDKQRLGGNPYTVSEISKDMCVGRGPSDPPSKNIWVNLRPDNNTTFTSRLEHQVSCGETSSDVSITIDL